MANAKAGQMENSVHAGGRFSAGVGIGDVAAQNRQGGNLRRVREVLAGAVGKVIEDRNGMSSGEEFIDKMGADKPGTSGNKVFHSVWEGLETEDFFRAKP